MMLSTASTRCPWNKGILVGQKRPLQPKNVWSIRVRLEISGAGRDLALFNLAIDSKLRACDLVRLRVEDLCSGCSIRDRATIIQKKTNRPVQFEVTEQTKTSLAAWLPVIRRVGGGYLFPSRCHRIYTPVCTDRPSLGFQHRPGYDVVRHLFHEKNQGYADLQKDR